MAGCFDRVMKHPQRILHDPHLVAYHVALSLVGRGCGDLAALGLAAVEAMVGK